MSKVKYLRKTKLYELSRILFPEISFPKMKNCSYSYGYSREGITFDLGTCEEIFYVSVSCLPSVRWFRLVIQNEDRESIYQVIKTISDLDDPAVTYSSCNCYSDEIRKIGITACA